MRIIKKVKEKAMFTNNRRYIGENETRDDYIRLDLRMSSPILDWERAIEIVRGRIEGRYLDPIRTLIQADVNKNGFAAMALCCLLIETLLQFREGFPQTPDRQNRQWYSNFLQTQLGHIFNRQMADRFYKDIRCGVLHSAQTKNGSCLTFGTDYTARILGNDVMMVNVQGMYQELDRYFGQYCYELMDSDNIDLRENFIKKMDDITKKWEGIEVIDNLWFAICEKENREIFRPNSKPFIFRVISNGTALKIYYERTGSRGGYVISKDEMQDALYYWPNETAIKMLDKGNIIFPILCQCGDIASDIVQRQIS